MNTSLLKDIADRLWMAEANQVPVAPIRDAIAESAGQGSTSEAAYYIQQLITQRRLADGDRLVGRKIGLTSPAVQKQLGVSEPDYGALFESMSVCDGESVSMKRLMQPKAEAEIAFILKRDLDYGRHTVADILAAVDYAVAAIEIVGSRISNWDIRLQDTIADNASSSKFVLGTRPVSLSQLDLVGCGMNMTSRGVSVSTGSGAACLGNPLNAVRWLADALARLKTPLRAGDVVLSGALGPMVPVAAGDVLVAEIGGLGSVRASFE